MKVVGNRWSAANSALAVCAVLFALCESASAQQPKKLPQIGFLADVSPATISARTEAFRQGLRELGDVEGKNIIIEWRYAEGKLDRMPALAAELVRLKVDVMSRQLRPQPVLPSKRLLRFPLSWRLMMTLLAMGSLPAWLDPVATSRDWQLKPRR